MRHLDEMGILVSNYSDGGTEVCDAITLHEFSEKEIKYPNQM